MFFTSSVGQHRQNKSRHTLRITCAEHAASCAIIQIRGEHCFVIIGHVLFTCSPTACGLNVDDYRYQLTVLQTVITWCTATTIYSRFYLFDGSIFHRNGSVELYLILSHLTDTKALNELS